MCPHATEDAGPRQPVSLEFIDPDPSLLTDNEINAKKFPFVAFAMVGGSGPEFLAIDTRKPECPVVFWSYLKTKFLPLADDLDGFLSSLFDSEEEAAAQKRGKKGGSLANLKPHFGSIRRLNVPHGNHRGEYLARFFEIGKLSKKERSTFDVALDGHAFLEDERYVPFAVMWSESHGELGPKSSLAEALMSQNEGILLFDQKSSSVALSDSGTTVKCVDDLNDFKITKV